MKYIDKYKELGIYSENEAFEYLLINLKDTIQTYDFFVAWDKVLGNASKVEISLNILNSLIGKKNVPLLLKEMIRSYPEIVPVIPLLIAVRDTSIKIANLGGNIEYSFFSRKSYSDEEIEKIVFLLKRVVS